MTCNRTPDPAEVHLVRRGRHSSHVQHGHAFALLVLGVALATLAFVLLGHRPRPEGSVASPSADDVADAVSAPQIRSRLLVRFEDGTPADVVRRTLEEAGVEQEDHIEKLGVRVVRVAPANRPAALAALASADTVEYAEREVRLTALETYPNDAYWGEQWGPRTVSAPQAWDVTRGSESVVIAVLDTGVQADHPDLAGAFVTGYDFVNEDPDTHDDHGHGTATAGVIAARTDNGRGIAGACWRCSIMPVKVLASDGDGDSATVSRGVVWAADRGAKVINLSLGGPETTQTLTDAVAYATGKGVLVVAGAGNEGGSTPFYPAASAGVIGVAATDESGERYEWSNYGDWVRVSAPGCNLAPLPGGEYGDYCGTSSAAPLVAGLVGLALSLERATREEIEHALERAGELTESTRYGRVDAARLLVNLGASAVTAVGPERYTSPVSQTRRGRLTIQEPLRAHTVSLEAGTIVTALTFARSSRLTLAVIDPEGTTIQRVSGRAPLRATTRVRAGSHRFVVSRPRGGTTSYTLRVTNLRASSG